MLALGLPNLVRVLGYRLGVQLGINPVRRIKANLPMDAFFTSTVENLTPSLTREGVKKSILYFGWYSTTHSSAPNWHQNPFSGVTVPISTRPWWQIPDFDPKLGDIKTVWEASRFDWVLHFAQQAIRGEQEALTTLNDWLADWCKNNPAYYGPNWKCGQEASIRVMHLALAALVLKQDNKPTSAIQTLVRAHLQRIALTIQYAIAQDNNHGTSEAAALFIGGNWLYSLGDNSAEKWAIMGRKWLENRASRLIEPDGSFSQYSVNYHRVMLDTYCMAEHWRKSWQLPVFSAKLYQQLQNATNWLYQMVQTETGDAPNLGANDGARLLPLSNTDYRDFRPSVQLAMAVFCNRDAYGKQGSWNELLCWLNISTPEKAFKSAGSTHFPNGGYNTLRADKVFVLLRFPNFRFRPSQADALHVDLWLEGQNLLRDAGTYSYNAGEEITSYFGGTASHNTIQFDGRDQMPRLSRFLFGEWLKVKNVIPIEKHGSNLQTKAGYRDYQGVTHQRTVTLSSESLKVQDSISGFKQKAILRWRLQPDNWTIADNTISNGKHQLSIQTDLVISRFEIVEGWESRYYFQKISLPVLEVEVQQPGDIITTYQF